MNNTVIKKENKKKTILDAAFSLFMKRGYANVKVLDIAEGAGIGKGTVYEYFKSKDDILMELVTSYVKKEFSELGEKVDKLPTFKEKLITLIRFEFDFLQRYGPHAPEFKQYVFDKNLGFSKELIAAINEMLHIEYANLENTLKFGITSGDVRDCDIPLAVHFIATTITSFVMLSSIDPAATPFYDGIDANYVRKYTPEEVYEVIMNGIGA